MTYKELEVDELTEIDSVSSFIRAVKDLKESANGKSTELYFRGQDAEFWDIEPSVFRNNMLSVEHRLMQIPLQKIPSEFKEYHTTFDIMTKYQHYGMCTRLLDLTTNPLVALYFACKCHGDEPYISDEGEESHEPYGVIYFTQNYYPSLPTDLEVQIISALANYDLSKENTVTDVFARLKRDGIIDEEVKKKWLQKDGFSEFVNIIQKNYMVTPTYTNERLRKQSGIFLLASLFTVSSGTDIAQSVISKSRDNLRREFEKDYFFVRGENKKEILRELDLYNINEATLFPELEHQLNYIKYVNSENVQAVSNFEKYEVYLKTDKDNIPYISSDGNLNSYIISNLSNILDGVAEADEIDELKDIIRKNFAVDWYKRETIISKMKMSILGYYFVKSKDKNSSKNKATQITELLKNAVLEYMPTNAESGE
ncbi:MAG: FRG domain-containing protein [Clostridiales bacterium]|nr:FRG domain-containing protein [Clostridiales bacterium]